MYTVVMQSMNEGVLEVLFYVKVMFAQCQFKSFGS